MLINVLRVGREQLAKKVGMLHYIQYNSDRKVKKKRRWIPDRHSLLQGGHTSNGAEAMFRYQHSFRC